MVNNNNRFTGNGRISDGGWGSGRNERSSTGPFNPYVPLTEDNYVDLAEQSIRSIGEHHKNKRGEPDILSTSKIRNILSLNAELYNDVINEPAEQLSLDFKGRINYMKVRILYEAGRETTVKYFVEESNLIKNIDAIKGSRVKYMLFSRYLEALVAYRKFVFGNDAD